MDTGVLVLVCARLFWGSVLSLLAIMLWARCHDAAWFALCAGAFSSCLNALYGVLRLFGVTFPWNPLIGSTPILVIILDSLPAFFFCLAFVIVIVRKYR